MIDVVDDPIDDEQAEMYIWPLADFCGLCLEHAVPIHPIFKLCPLNANEHDGGMVTVHHICQYSSTLTWILVD